MMAVAVKVLKLIRPGEGETVPLDTSFGVVDIPLCQILEMDSDSGDLCARPGLIALDSGDFICPQHRQDWLDLRELDGDGDGRWVERMRLAAALLP